MAETQQIKVLIVDDHVMVCRGLQVLLETHENFDVVGFTQNPKMLPVLCESLSPDVILMDIQMSEMDGVTATRMIRGKFPDIKIVALTSSNDQDVVLDMIKAGATGYLLKTASVNDVAEGIRAAYKGHATLAPEITEILLKHNNSSTDDKNQLSRQEQKVLELMVEGLSNNEMAEILFVSTATIKAHVSRILAKLNVPNRVKAVAFAIQNQLVERENA